MSPAAENRGAPEFDRAANILGALATVVADQTSAAIAGAAGQSMSAAAALSAMHEFLAGPTLDQLRRVLGLTPSGAVRLVDRLVTAGLVTRGPGGDGRSRAVTLTAEGSRIAVAIGMARAEVLRGLLQRLPAEQRDAVGPVVAALLEAVVTTKDGGAWICRLCDLSACGRAEGRCPAATAARQNYGALD